MSTTDIETRFARLERTNRRLTAFCFSFAVVMIVALVQGQAKPNGGGESNVMDEVRTKKLVIVDDDDEVRGNWVPMGIQIVDKERKSQLLVYATTINQAHMTGKRRFPVEDPFDNQIACSEVRVGWSIYSYELLNDEEIKKINPLVREFFTTRGSALDLYYESGAGRVRLAATNSGKGLNLSDEEGDLRAVIGTYDAVVVDKNGTAPKPRSTISLWDKDGKLMWQAP